MSVKIYDGLRIDIQANNILLWVEHIRKPAEEYYIKQISEMMAQAILNVETIRNLPITDNEKQNLKLYYVGNSISPTNYKYKITAENDDDDFDSVVECGSLIFYPTASYVLAIPLGVNNWVMDNVILSDPKAQEWGYWDNTDHSSELELTGEWLRRELDWRVILDRYGTIKENGLHIPLVKSGTKYFRLSANDMDTFIINPKRTAHKFAKKLVSFKYQHDEEINAQNAYAVTVKQKEFVENNKGMVDELTQKFIPCVPTKLTDQHISRKWTF